MTKDELIELINHTVYENEDGDITGEVMNLVLNAIVATIGVEANPDDEATGTLTKIKIGEEVFNVEGGGGTVDPYPTEGSTNPVQSGGVYSALLEKAMRFYTPDITDIPPTILNRLKVGDIVSFGNDDTASVTVAVIDEQNDIIILAYNDGMEVGGYQYQNGICTDTALFSLSGMANKVSGAANGHLAGLAEDGDLTDSGIAASDVATTSDLAGKQDVISDLATIRTGAAAGATAYQKPSTGIPKTDLASGVQTSLGKADTSIQNMSTPLSPDGTITATKANGDTIIIDLNHQHPNYYSKVAETTQPSGGMLPDVTYKLGTLTGATTFTFAAAVSGNVNHYYFIFTSGSTAVVPTWPSAITSWDGNCVDSTTGLPVIAASKTYEVSVLDGNAIIKEW